MESMGAFPSTCMHSIGGLRSVLKHALTRPEQASKVHHMQSYFSAVKFAA